MAKKADKSGDKLIVKNRRATFEYDIENRYEAGIELLGTEVKSLRAGQVNLADAYAQPDKGQLYLLHCNIAPYAGSSPELNHAPMRPRRLLLHRREIDALASSVSMKGYAIVPLSLYFKEGRVKVELGVARGRSHADRRDAIAEREQKREVDRAMRGAARAGRRVK